MTAATGPVFAEQFQRAESPLLRLPSLLGGREGGIGRAEAGAVAVVSATLPQRLRAVPVLKHCLVAVIDGVKHIRDDGEDGTAVAPAGWFVALRAGERPNIANLPDPATGRYRAVALTFDRETLAVPALPCPASRRVPPGYAVLPDDPALAESFVHAVAGLASPVLSGELARHRLAEVLLALAERGVGWSPADAEGPIQRVRLMISARPQLPWSAADAARLLGISEATLRRRLAAEGTCFREILAESRLSHGLGLLQTTRAGIAEVALACGYDSPSRFSGRFRERFGMPPSEVRGREG
ncbi:helix-turn-helix transcriptional regulator (plasmid) [Skermanella sp. TT6]|uniref:Helix-turn-helix transcriptional regulator n=1 Tax=Skermanella cutis TaxID=2775420 RepID=A0ABX7BK90_9PROT|nr:helix-turn-helix transcriptional regulator [Skermanella sp. TT6]QQP93467.1 helix-turn-helix transcriptional regulator [Skermanella sp. TT6]